MSKVISTGPCHFDALTPFQEQNNIVSSPKPASGPETMNWMAPEVIEFGKVRFRAVSIREF